MTSIAVKTLLSETTSVTYTPGYEGANIGTIIGFKHVNYLVEKAVIEHFRRSGLAVGALYESTGVGFDIIDIKTKLSAALLVDDDVDAVVTPTTGDSGNVASFSVELTVQRDGAPKRAVRSKVQVQFRRDGDERRMTKRAPLPEGLDRFVVDYIGGSEPGAAITEFGAPLMSGASSDDDPVSRKLVEGRNAYAWRFKVPYPYIHFFERLQMSAYLRLMEEAKSRFRRGAGLLDRRHAHRAQLDPGGVRELGDDHGRSPHGRGPLHRLLGQGHLQEHALHGDDGLLRRP